METYILNRMKSSQVRTCSYGQARLPILGFTNIMLLTPQYDPSLLGAKVSFVMVISVNVLLVQPESGHLSILTP